MKKFLKNLTKLANRLDSAGLTKEADRIDRIIRIAVEEWEYHGYGSPEEYERVRRMRRPELYEGPEGKKTEIKEDISPETTEYMQKRSLLVPSAMEYILWMYGASGAAEYHGDSVKDIGSLGTAIVRREKVDWNKLSDNKREIIINALKWIYASSRQNDLSDNDLYNIGKFVSKLSRIGISI